MGFPARKSSGTLLTSARGAQDQVRERTTRVRNLAVPIVRTELIELLGVLSRSIDVWTEAEGLTGVRLYARTEYDSPGLDIVAEITAMRISSEALRDWIFANFPKSGGAWLIQSRDINGATTWLTFDATFLAPFIVLADDVISAT